MIKGLNETRRLPRLGKWIEWLTILAILTIYFHIIPIFEVIKFITKLGLVIK